MAQAVAAYAGLVARSAGEPIRIGYLIGVRELKLEAESFVPGDVLTVRARRVWGDDQLGNFEADVTRSGVEVARASLTVFREGPGMKL